MFSGGMFSGGIKRDQWHEIGKTFINYEKSMFHQKILDNQNIRLLYSEIFFWQWASPKAFGSFII